MALSDLCRKGNCFRGVNWTWTFWNNLWAQGLEYEYKPVNLLANEQSDPGAYIQMVSASTCLLVFSFTKSRCRSIGLKTAQFAPLFGYRVWETEPNQVCSGIGRWRNDCRRFVCNLAGKACMGYIYWWCTVIQVVQFEIFLVFFASWMAIMKFMFLST